MIRRLRDLMSFLLLALLVLFLTPVVAMAQDGGFSLLSLVGGDVGLYVLVALAVVELAKRVVAIIPGKPYSAEIGVFEGLLRRILDFVAGKNGDPKDTSLIKKE